MTAVAEGNYASACSTLTPGAQRALIAKLGRRRSCEAVFQHCIPVNPLALKRDQSQLLFAGVLPVIHGSHSSVRVSGTRVARELRNLTMVRTSGSWRITGPGRALSRCRSKRSARHRATKGSAGRAKASGA